MKKLGILLLALTCLTCQQKNSNNTFITQFEKSGGTETSEYIDVISYYKELSNSYPEISFFEMGETDAGYTIAYCSF